MDQRKLNPVKLWSSVQDYGTHPLLAITNKKHFETSLRKLHIWTTVALTTDAAENNFETDSPRRVTQSITSSLSCK